MRVTPVGRARSDGTPLTELMVVGQPAPGTDAALNLVGELRNAVHAVPGADARVGGAVAADADARAGTQHDLLLIAPLVLAVRFLVLLVLQRSLIAPVILLAINLVSAVAAIGAGAWLSRVLLHQPPSPPTLPARSTPSAAQGRSRASGGASIFRTMAPPSRDGRLGSPKTRWEVHTMRKLFSAAFAYMVLGVASGLFYREFTKANGFTDARFTQLSVVHTHLLVLGFVVLLIVLVLEKLFTLSASRLFTWFFWIYNAGLVITAAMLTVHGMQQVTGAQTSAAIPGIAGVGHTLLAAGMVLLFLALGSRLTADRAAKASAVPLHQTASDNVR